MMKADRKILIAFLLNLFFSVFEIIGGAFTGSVAILSDALHDLGDAAGIGVSYFLERKSKKEPDENYTYGYLRYSVMGSVITTTVLTVGSLIVIYNAVRRIIEPTEINYDGMIVFALVGTAVNFIAAQFTKEGDSLNQKAVNLHMLEDMLGWIIVLIGAVIMRFTDIRIIDPIMSVAVAVFILINALRNLKEALDLFLEKTPRNISVSEIEEHIREIDGIADVHHIHIWSMDGINNYATLHIVTDKNTGEIKERVREELSGHGIGHSVIETEGTDEHCHEKNCTVSHSAHSHHHHHHHHH